ARYGWDRPRAPSAQAAASASADLYYRVPRARHRGVRSARDRLSGEASTRSAPPQRAAKGTAAQAPFGPQAKPFAGGGAPLSVGDRAIAGGARSHRRNRLPQGGAQIHNDTYRRSGVSPRGVAHPPGRGIRPPLRARAPELSGRA